jgi:L-fuconolactonase
MFKPSSQFHSRDESSAMKSPATSLWESKLEQRRLFLRQCCATGWGLGFGLGLECFDVSRRAAGAAEEHTGEQPLPTELIIDTHQHLWSLQHTTPPWLAGAEAVLRQEYGVEQYRSAIGSLNVQAVYMEVDVAPSDHVAEAQQVLQLIDQPESITRAAVIGGRPSDPAFAKYLDNVASSAKVKGVRQVLHGGDTPPGYCLQADFVRGIRLLGQRKLMFDLCLRPTELQDAAKLIRQVPETYFILDHCGNADVNAFRVGNPQPSHDPDQWRRGIEAIAALPNVSCKISGVVAKAPHGWQPADLAVVVNHCLDAFGPERVIFGSDWPVCLLGSPLQPWVSALHQIIQNRSAEHRNLLWHGNAQLIYFDS